jgi:hypothetical protein
LLQRTIFVLLADRGNSIRREFIEPCHIGVQLFWRSALTGRRQRRLLKILRRFGHGRYTPDAGRAIADWLDLPLLCASRVAVVSAVKGRIA